jgi:poly(A) polymerase
MLLYAKRPCAQVSQGLPALTQKKDIAITPPVQFSINAIACAQINENALKVLRRLGEGGYDAYLVGGCVRDLLLGRVPKDFDIVTNAHPEQIARLFRNCRLIGRRFRLAHIHFGRDIVEVATYRGRSDDKPPDALTDNGRILRDNVYGETLEEDAWRRDFTINALYWDPKDLSIIDYTGGIKHLKTGLLQLLGDPWLRYREDPVRMLRAVRFAAKLGFKIHLDSETPLLEHTALLDEVSPARLFEEVLKLFMGGCAVRSFELLRHYRLFRQLFPQSEQGIEKRPAALILIQQALANTDTRIAQGKPVTPAFLFAALLWEPVRALAEQLRADNMSDIQALQVASEKVVSRQLSKTALPKRFSIPMREIWSLQPRLRQRNGKRPQRLLAHPRFRAAYDFLLLRVAAGEETQELADWWTGFQTVEPGEQQAITKTLDAPSGPRRRRRRKSKN